MSTTARTTDVRRTRGVRGGAAARRIGIAAIVVYCLAPFYWMVVSSLRQPADQFSNGPLPAPLSLDNYAAAFDARNGFGQALLNSLAVAGATTALTLIVAIFAGYALARLHFRGKTLVLTLIIAASMFPPITLVVPLLRLFTDAGWINTYQAMIVPSMSFALPLAVWNLTAFFRQMPTELEKAAQVDGCTPAQAFRKVVLPLAAPGIFTTAILVFICAWNEFLIAVSVVNDKQMMTANVIVSLFTGQYKYDQPFGTQMAAGVVVTLPLVLAVLFFQRRIVDGLTAGGLK
ncbi:carbohydrate ABC transporter permease [Streptomyces sp. NPDC005355]|uniref:carbohydrate ABC transporter permease n=1 Tax=Streptomyces sp. NPDC005355 TaxID=3157038 RepID=UPI0033BB1C53